MKLFIYLFALLSVITTNVYASTNNTESKQLKSKQTTEKRLASLGKDSINDFSKNQKQFAVLSAKDIKIYKRLFKYQRSLQRTKVAQLIPQLTDKSLIGHLMAVRLLHPKTKASYADLKTWMASYNDHHQAKTIYSLANIRKPKTSAHKKPVRTTKNIAKYTDPDNQLEKPSDKNIKYTLTRKKLMKQLNSSIKKRQFKKAETILKSTKNKRLLGDSTYTKYGLRLVKKLFNDQKFADAHRVAKKVGRMVQPMVYEAVWYEGLSAFNNKEYKYAASAFRRLANNVPGGSKYYSKASYWAGLSYQKSNKKSMEKVFLKQASTNKYSFYGLLANEQLGLNPKMEWNKPQASAKEVRTLLKNKKIKRVIALSQIGEVNLAQKELRIVYSSIPYGMDEALLAMTLELNLSWNSLTLSYNLLERNKVFLEGLYPDISNWKPKRATVDYSLINAIIKQESAFSPSVKSSAGAMGLMQIMPGTAQYIRSLQGKRSVPKYKVFDPKLNVNMGQYYLGYLLEEFNGNLMHAIAAYNAGPGNVRKWIKNGLGDNGPVAFAESIPFPETKKYVQKVMANYWIYRVKFNQSLSNLRQVSRNKWPKDTYSLAFRLK